MDTTAVIVSVGTELTSGQTVDTNSTYIARRLAELGIVAVEHVVVDDHQGRIVQALRRAASTSPAVVVSGGLGPTADDLTRQALAEAMGVELVTHEESLEHIAAFFRARGRAMHEANRIQAMLPRGASVLANPIGTAPGIHAVLGGAQVFVVPGVPVEMRRMIDEQVLPRLAALAGGQTTVFRMVHTFGTGESDVGVRIADLMRRDANPLVGTTVADGVVSVRIIARAQGRQAADALAGSMVRQVTERLGELVFGTDLELLPDVVGRLLAQRGETLAVAESCTGGLLGARITEVSGSSAYFLGGVISYANRVKEESLGVPAALLQAHGAVSEEVAGAMAQGVRQRLGATYGLSITGIAGPTGGSAAKPVGLVYIGLATPRALHVQRAMLGGERGMVRLRAALWALNMLRLELIH